MFDEISILGENWKTEKCNRFLDSMSVEYLSQAILNQSPECGDKTLSESFYLCFRFSQVHTTSKLWISYRNLSHIKIQCWD